MIERFLKHVLETMKSGGIKERIFKREVIFDNYKIPHKKFMEVCEKSGLNCKYVKTDYVLTIK